MESSGKQKNPETATSNAHQSNETSSNQEATHKAMAETSMSHAILKRHHFR